MGLSRARLLLLVTEFASQNVIMLSVIGILVIVVRKTQHCVVLMIALLDITQCSEGCLSKWLGDGVCNTVCFNSACGWDGNDCG